VRECWKKAVVGVMTAIENQQEPTRRTPGVASSPPSLLALKEQERESKGICEWWNNNRRRSRRKVDTPFFARLLVF
jgi:hypothetical protein